MILSGASNKLHLLHHLLNLKIIYITNEHYILNNYIQSICIDLFLNGGKAAH